MTGVEDRDDDFDARAERDYWAAVDRENAERWTEES